MRGQNVVSKRLHFPFCPWVLVQCGSKVSRRKLEWGTQWKWWAGKAKGEQRGDGCRGTSALKLYLRFLIIFFLTAYILSLVWCPEVPTRNGVSAWKP